MEKKVSIIIEIIIIVVAILYYSVKIMIPEYKNSQGSSDHFIKSGNVSNMIEIRIDSATDFAIILDLDGNIYHLFFFDNLSIPLYNKSIESQTMDTGLETIIKILIGNNLLRNGSQIELLYMEDTHYNFFKNKWNEYMNKYALEVNTSERKQSLEEKAIELGIDTQANNNSLLLEIDFYSKEIIKDNKDSFEILNEVKAKEYTNAVYKKLEEIVLKKQSELVENNIAITLIPADGKHHYYPTDNSWYKVEDDKIIAFIELQDNHETYSYCYNGSIENILKGECQE